MLRSYPKKSTGRGTEWNEENENYVVLRKPLGKKHLFRGLLNWLPSHGSLQSCVILHQGNSALLGTSGTVRRHTWVSQLGTCYWHGQRPRTLLHGLQCTWEPPRQKNRLAQSQPLCWDWFAHVHQEGCPPCAHTPQWLLFLGSNHCSRLPSLLECQRIPQTKPANGPPH